MPRQATSLDEPRPDLLRRLNEFQVRVRQVGTNRASEIAVPARGPLSGMHAAILTRLRSSSPPLADSMEQALTDLNDQTRISYVGPAGELREVLRATVQVFAPDEEVRKQRWFVGIEQGDKRNPSQAERMRYAVQVRGGDEGHVTEAQDLIDKLVGQVARQTYTLGSKAFHAGTEQARVRKLAGWIFALLDEVLPE